MVQLSSKQRAKDTRASESGVARVQTEEPSFTGADEGVGRVDNSILSGAARVIGVGGSTCILGKFTFSGGAVFSAEIPWMSCWRERSRNLRQKNHSEPLQKINITYH
jgi:hypothetical protein